MWLHEHCRFVCDNRPCRKYEVACRNEGQCEYPMPAGSKAWCAKHGNTIWAHGRWVDVEIQRMYEAPLESLPPPYDEVLDVR